MSVAEFFRKFSFLRKGNVMQNESWDVRMDGDMVIAGLSERTREAYLRAARQLAQFHQMADPGTLEEQHVKDYLLWLRTEKRAAPGTLRIALAQDWWTPEIRFRRRVWFGVVLRIRQAFCSRESDEFSLSCRRFRCTRRRCFWSD